MNGLECTNVILSRLVNNSAQLLVVIERGRRAPETEKQSEQGENKQFFYGVTSMQGWRDRPYYLNIFLLIID
jgi:hypothetical protein